MSAPVDAELLALAHAIADPAHPTKASTSAWACSSSLAERPPASAGIAAMFTDGRA